MQYTYLNALYDIIFPDLQSATCRHHTALAAGRTRHTKIRLPSFQVVRLMARTIYRVFCRPFIAIRIYAFIISCYQLKYRRA